MQKNKRVKYKFLILKIWNHLSNERKKNYILINNNDSERFAELITISLYFLTVLLDPEKLINLQYLLFFRANY